MNRSVLISSVLCGATLFGCTPDAGQGLVFQAPSRLLQAATSTDAALCDRLAVDFTFREQSAAGAELDRVPLTQDQTCEWLLEDDGEYARGTYDMLVRFRPTGNFRGAPDCEEQDNDVWVGAHYIADVDFPFADGFGGFGDDTFLSLPEHDVQLATIEDRFGFSTRSFDIDADSFDNLVEVSGDSHPCRANAPPVTTLVVNTPAVDEGQPVTISVSSVEVDGLQHDVLVTARHENGAEYAPETVQVRLRTYTPDDFLADEPTEGQTWNWAVDVEDALDDNLGAAEWTVTFLPDEPFVGDVSFTAIAVGKGEGTALADATEPQAATVTNVPDAAKLFVELEDGTLEPIDRLAFAEQGAVGAPTTLKLRAESGDIGVSLTGNIALGQAPDSMVIGEDFSFTTLTYEPTNAEALAGDLEVELLFTDGDGNDIAQTFPIDVSPTYNNAVYFPPFEGVNTNLADAAFSFKRFRFDIVDPDRVSGDLTLEPTCEVTAWPEGDEACATACCQNAWESIECETDGAIEGETWHMVATLTPSVTYFADCGAEPIFTVQLSATDVAPADAMPANNITATTVDDCYLSDDDNCREHLRFTTAGAVAHQLVSGFGGALTDSINGTSGALIDGVNGMALMSVLLDGTRTFVAVDLNQPPTVERLYTAVEFEQWDDIDNNFSSMGAVDTINHRALTWGWNDAGQTVALFDLQPPYDVTNYDFDGFCNNVGDPSYPPVVDALGDIFQPCGGSSEGSVTRLDGAGNITFADVSFAIEGGNGYMGTGIIEDDVGAEWLVIPNGNGLHALELMTFDDPMPNVVAGAPESVYNSGTVEAWAVTEDRRGLILVYNHFPTSLDAASIIRVHIEGGAMVIDPPLPLEESTTNNGSLWHRVVMRGEEPGEQPEEADMLVTGGGSSTDERVFVDLDSWQIVPGRDTADFTGIGLEEVFESPDPHFYVGVMTGGSGNDYTDGLVMYPWDNAEAPISYDLGVPSSFELRQGWITVSREFKAMVINEDEHVVVVYFLQVP